MLIRTLPLLLGLFTAAAYADGLPDDLSSQKLLPQQSLVTPASVLLNGRYGPIRCGETLWSIANRHRPATTVSVAQTMVALYKKNPQSFEDGNINHLLVNSYLDLPSLAEVKAVNRKAARQRFKQDNTAWQGIVPRYLSKRNNPDNPCNPTLAMTQNQLFTPPPPEAAAKSTTPDDAEKSESTPKVVSSTDAVANTTAIHAEEKAPTMPALNQAGVSAPSSAINTDAANPSAPSSAEKSAALQALNSDDDSWSTPLLIALLLVLLYLATRRTLTPASKGTIKEPSHTDTAPSKEAEDESVTKLEPQASIEANSVVPELTEAETLDQELQLDPNALSHEDIDRPFNPEQESTPSDTELMSSSVEDELAVKLDLARAYFEIDEFEKSKALLQELLHSNNPSVKEEAERLLSKL